LLVDQRPVRTPKIPGKVEDMFKTLWVVCAMLLAVGAQAQDTGTLKKIRDAKSSTPG
jgi:hypothetical protein